LLDLELLVTGLELILAALPPELVCNELKNGLVYATVTISPKTTGLAKVNRTVAPVIATELTVLRTELTLTLKENV
jgi:hypothetical protein